MRRRSSSDHEALSDHRGFEPPFLLRRATLRSINLNVGVFLLLGCISLWLDIRAIKSGAHIANDRAMVFLMLTPAWIVGAHYACRILRRYRPSLRDAISFALKVALAFAGAVALFKLLLDPMHFDDVFHSLMTIVVLTLAVMCFITVGFVNGYFGILFSVYNLIALVGRARHGQEAELGMWIDLFGLIDIDVAIYQWFMIGTTFVLALSERTFSVIDAAIDSA
ncbi:hypothetical protein [Leptothrix discophora]|uniref:Cation transporter n=1 Tax=Leptothrix discophora TaxID=89 RepID=A0ABT9FY05_LEPDI|nr:hypothetical protein [Leptothrix discophora]MDP4299125.1 hypothetical protein [Leptothrix discophora]